MSPPPQPYRLTPTRPPGRLSCFAGSPTQHTNNTKSNIVRICGAVQGLLQTSQSHASNLAPELFGTRPGASDSTVAMQRNTAKTCRPAALPLSWPRFANPGPPVDNIGLDPATFGKARIDRLRERERQMHGKLATSAQRMSGTGAAPDRIDDQSGRMTEFGVQWKRLPIFSARQRVVNTYVHITHVRKCWIPMLVSALPLS